MRTMYRLVFRALCLSGTLMVVLAEETGLRLVEDTVDTASDCAAHSKAPNTLKAYRIDWADFSDWCALHRPYIRDGSLFRSNTAAAVGL
jgi:hypothetical protein